MLIIYSKGVRIGLRFFCHRNLINETTIRPKNLDRWQHITRLAARGATTYNKTDGEGPAGEESVGQPPSRTMTHWSDTVTSRRYTVHFSGESD